MTKKKQIWDFKKSAAVLEGRRSTEGWYWGGAVIGAIGRSQTLKRYI